MTAISTRINTLLLLLVLVALLAVIAMLATGARGGPLDPPGLPASTLPQVEPRSPIPPVGWNGTFPIVISQPGSYFFTRSLTGASCCDGLQITADNVSIDLNGFTFHGGGSPAEHSGSAIGVLGHHSGIHITNGVVRHWYHGISGWGTAGEAVYSRVDHITAIDNVYGIMLGFDSEITDCNASHNNFGIYTHYSVVRGCHATDNTSYGIYAQDVSLIEGNKAWNNGYGIVVTFSGAQPGNNTVRSNTSTNNTTADINFNGTGNVSDSNVVTCPGWHSGAVQTYNVYFQRNIC